jgi:hypothetical protein
MNQFKFPPISTLSGTTLLNYFKVLRKGHKSPRYYFRIFLTFVVILIATPFHWWEYWVYHKKLSKYKLKKPPLFIIGHWRSGTTLLHNLLCQDPTAGYLTTYHSVFSNNLTTKWLFKTFMKRNMPNKRPSDNVELNINFPQEDEFAFLNQQAFSYYNFFSFPENFKTFYAEGVHHENLSRKEIKEWFKSYDKLLKKALINTKGDRIIIKNPVNTARIKHLLKLYPDARFLFIYRNPFIVFISTRYFFQQLLPTLVFQKTDNELIEKAIFDIYIRLMDDYQEQKSLIPPENLMELRYEEFEQRPEVEIRRIYSSLLKEDFSPVENYFCKYLESIKGYKKNSYTVDQKTIDQISKHWEKYIKLYNYSIPDEVRIKKD